MHLLCRYERRFPRFTRAQSIGGHRESSSTGRTITTRNRTSVCIILFCTSVYKTQSCLTFLSVVIKFISRRFLFFFFSRVKNILTWRFDTKARRCFFVAPRDVSVAFFRRKNREKRRKISSFEFTQTHARSHTQHSRKYSLFCEHPLDNDDVFILVCLAACICTTPTKIFFFFIFEEEFIFFFDDSDDASTLVKTWRNHEFKSFVFPKRCHHEQRGANPNETHGRTESGVHFQLQNLRWWR